MIYQILTCLLPLCLAYPNTNRIRNKMAVQSHTSCSVPNLTKPGEILIHRKQQPSKKNCCWQYLPDKRSNSKLSRRKCKPYSKNTRY